MAHEIRYEIGKAGNFRLLNFATGSYNCICSVCGKNFIGDKLATQCLGCALKLVEKGFAPTDKTELQRLLHIAEKFCEESNCVLCKETIKSVQDLVIQNSTVPNQTKER